MKNILTKLILVCFLCTCLVPASAQETDLNKYHRSSLYSILLKHPEKEFCNEMIEAFKSIPIPDKYNNHDLKIKVMPSPVLKALTKDEIEGAYKDAITKMLTKNKIGGRLIEKWFNRNKTTGSFDMELVAERGYYDASILDVKEARVSAKGTALLADAGEELLNHTYVIVNDIRYADKETMKGAIAGGLFAAQLVGSFFGVDLSNVTSAVGGLTNDIAGFKVIVTSYLFRLDWNDVTADNFYSNLWIDKSAPNAERQKKWGEAMGDFKLKYIGCATVFSGKTSLGGVEKEKDMFLKVCTRAIDKSISDLQKSFDEFKVFTPLISTEPLCAYIGLKEGVDEDSRYEVLEKILDSNGRTKYERVGEIKPVKGQIWDNRFMAEFDKEDGSNLKYTTFKKMSGKEFYPGMLIREIR
ncbi:MAG: hypothetical protein U0K35_04710 [Prevotella sp.]|nr:hypothetical protein [Prevotella sp.]